MTRYSIYAGRFTITDYFDDNNYTHDPQTQFMAWGVMYNGAWDYPVDPRGYTWGIVQEFHTRKWSFRYGIVAEPQIANGSVFDRRLFRIVPGFYTTFDVQRDTNPGYNHDRGPVMIYSIRLHIGLGLKPWQRQ